MSGGAVTVGNLKVQECAERLGIHLLLQTVYIKIRG